MSVVVNVSVEASIERARRQCAPHPCTFTVNLCSKEHPIMYEWPETVPFCILGARSSRSKNILLFCSLSLFCISINLLFLTIVRKKHNYCFCNSKNEIIRASIIEVKMQMTVFRQNAFESHYLSECISIAILLGKINLFVRSSTKYFLLSSLSKWKRKVSQCSQQVASWCAVEVFAPFSSDFYETLRPVIPRPQPDRKIQTENTLIFSDFIFRIFILGQTLASF